MSNDRLSQHRRFRRRVRAHRAPVVLGVGGAALFLLACSEGVPPAAEGAWTAQFVGSAGSCNIMTHEGNVGDATQERYGLLQNGAPGVEVACLVVDDGGSFEARGIVRGDSGNRSLQFSIPSISPAATVDEPASGSVSFRTPQTTNHFASPTEVPCEFWFTDFQEIAAGRIWVTFHCGEVTDGSNVCSIGDRNPGGDVSVGSVAVQNCDQ